MNLNREDVVQSALNVQRWCEKHSNFPTCDCPFFQTHKITDCAIAPTIPRTWHLEEKLRTRGMQNGN